MHFELAAQSAAQLRHVEPHGLHVVMGRRQQRGVRHVAAQPVGNDRFDLGDDVAGGGGKLRICPRLDDAGTEHERLDLRFGEHEGRQVKSCLEDVANAGFSLDGDAARDQVLDVAIDGALRHLEGGAQLARPHQLLAAQVLDDLEQSVGAAHGSSRRCLWMGEL